jgi:hypothetical protein
MNKKHRVGINQIALVLWGFLLMGVAYGASAPFESEYVNLDLIWQKNKAQNLEELRIGLLQAKKQTDSLHTKTYLIIGSSLSDVSLHPRREKFIYEAPYIFHVSADPIDFKKPSEDERTRYAGRYFYADLNDPEAQRLFIESGIKFNFICFEWSTIKFFPLENIFSFLGSILYADGVVYLSHPALIYPLYPHFSRLQKFPQAERLAIAKEINEGRAKTTLEKLGFSVKILPSHVTGNLVFDEILNHEKFLEEDTLLRQEGFRKDFNVLVATKKKSV